MSLNLVGELGRPLTVEELDGNQRYLLQHDKVPVVNNTGSTIPKGTPVMRVGAAGGRVSIQRMDGSNRDNAKLYIGLTLEAIPVSGNGMVGNAGSIEGLTLTGFSVGNVLYVSPTVVGGLTNVEPTTGVKLPVAYVTSTTSIIVLPTTGGGSGGGYVLATGGGALQPEVTNVITDGLSYNLPTGLSVGTVIEVQKSSASNPIIDSVDTISSSTFTGNTLTLDVYNRFSFTKVSSGWIVQLSTTESWVNPADYVSVDGNQTIGGNKVFSNPISGSITGNAGTVTNGVYTSGNQTIGGTKTFSSAISGSITGNAGTVTNGVYTSGNQTIGGTKTFSSIPVLPSSNPTTDNQAVRKAYVDSQVSQVQQDFSASLVPVIVANGSSYVIPEGKLLVEIVCLGNATVTFPASPPTGAKYVVKSTDKDGVVTVTLGTGHQITDNDGVLHPSAIIEGLYQLDAHWLGAGVYRGF